MLKEKKKLSFMSKEANPVVLAPMLAKRKPSFFSLQEESARRGRRHTCQTQLGARGLPEPFSDGTRGGAEGGCEGKPTQRADGWRGPTAKDRAADRQGLCKCQ